jgi:hypothetical protein
MTPKQRFIAALERRRPDRLPVTTHHLMPSFLETTMGGMDERGFFDGFGFDPIVWKVAHRPSGRPGEYPDPPTRPNPDSSKRAAFPRRTGGCGKR